MFRATSTLSRNVLATLRRDKLYETFHSVTYPATAKIVARQVARKVELNSTFGNGSCNLSRNDCWPLQDTLHCEIFRAIKSLSVRFFWGSNGRARSKRPQNICRICHFSATRLTFLIIKPLLFWRRWQMLARLMKWRDDLSMVTRRYYQKIRVLLRSSSTYYPPITNRPLRKIS